MTVGGHRSFKCHSLIVRSAVCVLVDNLHAPVSVRKLVNMCRGVNCMFGLSPQGSQCQIGGLAADGVGCEIRLALTHGRRLCWCEVAVGESGVQRSPPWELALALRRSTFTYVSVSAAQLQTVFLQQLGGRMLNVIFFFLSLSLKRIQTVSTEYCMLFMLHFSLWTELCARSLYITG